MLSASLSVDLSESRQARDLFLIILQLVVDSVHKNRHNIHISSRQQCQSYSKRDNIMTKSELFKKAHQVTRTIIQKGDSYSATFAFALKYMYGQTSNPVQKLVAAGGKTWTAYGKHRVYFDDDVVLAILGYDCKSMSNNAWYKLRDTVDTNKHYYDVDNKRFETKTGKNQDAWAAAGQALLAK